MSIKMAVYFFKLCLILSLMSSSLAKDRPLTFGREDFMGKEEKMKMIRLSEDLYRDALLQMRQIFEIREEHDMFISFGVGMVMGRIREKYRNMIATYQDIMATYQDRTRLSPPGLREFRPIYIIIALEMIHYLEVEIDKLVDVLIDEAESDLESMRLFMGQTDPRPTTLYDVSMMNSTMSNKGSARSRARVDIKKEEAQKSLLRQQFLMKKLGLPVDMTTQKKRFLRHWPVEDTWKLNKYNHDYK